MPDEETKTTLSESIKSEYPFRHFNGSERGGYAGTAMLSRIKPDKVVFGIPRCRTKDIKSDKEGRVITAYFDNLAIVNVYTPNSGQNGLKRLEFRTTVWDSCFRRYLVSLRKK